MRRLRLFLFLFYLHHSLALHLMYMQVIVNGLDLVVGGGISIQMDHTQKTTGRRLVGSGIFSIMKDG